METTRSVSSNGYRTGYSADPAALAALLGSIAVTFLAIELRKLPFQKRLDGLQINVAWHLSFSAGEA